MGALKSVHLFSHIRRNYVAKKRSRKSPAPVEADIHLCDLSDDYNCHLFLWGISRSTNRTAKDRRSGAGTKRKKALASAESRGGQLGIIARPSRGGGILGDLVRALHASSHASQ